MNLCYPLKFEIPKGYRRIYFFQDKEALFKQWIIFAGGKMDIISSGECPPRHWDLHMYWNFRTMEEVRKELGVE